MNRRAFLGTAAAGAIAAPSKIAIIDAHIHLFDPTRPESVPWPPKSNALLYKPALPDRYRGIVGPFGITGAVVVEASPLVEDNQWVLDTAGKDPIIAGVVGNLEPGKPGFGSSLDRFRRHRLFKGIRYGNLWGRDLPAEIAKPEFVADLKRLAQAGLTLDTANPNPKLIEAIVRVTDAVPDLQVVIDHLPQMRLPEEPGVLLAYRGHLQELRKRPRVYVKLSEVFRRADGQVPRDLSNYRATLDELFDVFGEDRVIYGSDWPNSDNWLPFADGLQLMQGYFGTKSQNAAEKYFRRNAIAAYRLKV